MNRRTGISQTESTMRCRTCGYDLHGLTGHRCPECARGFDPGDPGTYLVRPIRAERNLALVFVGLMVFMLPMALARSDDVVERIPIVLIPLFPISIITGLSIGATIGWRCVLILRSRHPWVTHRWALYAASILGCGLFAVFIVRIVWTLFYYAVLA